MTDGAKRRERRMWLVAVLALSGFVAVLLTVGSLGGRRSELRHIPVADVLTGATPTDRFGNAEISVVGWYAELPNGCGTDSDWLGDPCPARVLLSVQPPADAQPTALLDAGLRLASASGEPFPPRAQPDGLNLQLQQIVFTGHFDDPFAADCAAMDIERCRNTFVVIASDGLLR